MSEKTKRMPSEHRISGLEPGEIQTISNDFGEFILLRLPFKDGEYGYKFIDNNKVIDAVTNHCDNHNDMMNDAINEKTNEYMEDSK